MRRVIAGLAALLLAALVSACGPDQPQKDWSKYSAPLPVQSGQQTVH